MKKGFTLIELLAVIVILAIIALIATPIILGIINDAREESNERSVELYASAVRNAIASYQLTNPNAPKSFSELNIEHDGNIVCTTEELYVDGSFYISDCTVNGDEVEYTYGEQQELPSTQVYKPQYYYFGYDWSGTVGETAAPTNPSSVAPSGETRYLGYDVTDGKVTAAYACFTRNDVEYCLKGYATEAFATNTEIIKDAYSDILNDACSSDLSGTFQCSAGGLRAYVGVFTDVIVGDGDAECYVDLGSFMCHE